MVAELIIAPEAQQDLDEAYYWYENRRLGLGEEFLGCVDACIQAICCMPETPRESPRGVSSGIGEAISVRHLL